MKNKDLHTPEPWSYETAEPGWPSTRDDPGDAGYPAYVVATMPDDKEAEVAVMEGPGYWVEPEDEYDDGFRAVGDPSENARRIVACVNACQGISTVVLESMPRGFLEEILSVALSNALVHEKIVRSLLPEWKARKNDGR